MTRKMKAERPSRFADRIQRVATSPAVGREYVDVRQRSDRAERQPTFKAATLTFITGDRIEVIVKNLSTTGARVEFMRNVRLADRVLLSEPTLCLQIWAYVIWQVAGVAGIEFATR